METTCVDTSLSLNVIPPQHMDVAAEVLFEELHRLSCENKKLTETLKQVCEKYLALKTQFGQLKNTSSEKEATPSRKRKAESESCNNMFGVSAYTECSATTIEEETFKRPKHNASPKVSKVFVRTEASDTSLYVRDGYQWRKYGQKVTRNNPSPRAYFRCSFGPNCPVKKKVQKSAEDPTLLVATYEGEHNHVEQHQAEISLMSCSSQNESPAAAVSVHACSSSVSVPLPLSPIMNRSPTVTLDLVQSGLVDNAQKPSIPQVLVQQMATSLTKDPNFTAALAAAISGRILDTTSIKNR